MRRDQMSERERSKERDSPRSPEERPCRSQTRHLQGPRGRHSQGCRTFAGCRDRGLDQSIKDDGLQETTRTEEKDGERETDKTYARQNCAKQRNGLSREKPSRALARRWMSRKDEGGRAESQMVAAESPRDGWIEKSRKRAVSESPRQMTSLTAAPRMTDHLGVLSLRVSIRFPSSPSLVVCVLCSFLFFDV